MDADLKYKPFIYVVLKMVQWRLESHLKENSKVISDVGKYTFNNKLNDIGATIVNRKLFFIINANGGKENLYSVFDNFHFDGFGLFEKDIPTDLRYGGINVKYNEVSLYSNSWDAPPSFIVKEVLNNLKFDIRKISPNFCNGIDRSFANLKKSHPEFVTDSLQNVVGKMFGIFSLRQYKLLFDKYKMAIGVDAQNLEGLKTTYSPEKPSDFSEYIENQFARSTSVEDATDFSKTKKSEPKKVDPPKSNFSKTAKIAGLSGITNFEEFSKRIERKNPKKPKWNK